ncbi:MAG: hypothetical protein L3K03_03745 [Thermoplasmata archaeon]|nr:hypothetical protein [Thermoplasmata archaeon]
MTTAEGRQIVCPQCQAIVPVEEDWRLVLCPKCGQPVTRMGDDAKYD